MKGTFRSVTSYIIWFMISEKSITRRCACLHHGACMHQKSQQGIQKILLALKLPLCGLLIRTRIEFIERDRSFKTFLNENYAIALGSCFLFTKKKKMLNMELLNMISIVFMETGIPEIYSRFDEYLAI